MTPVTRHLFAFNESATGDLDKANQYIAQKQEGLVLGFNCKYKAEEPSAPTSVSASFPQLRPSLPASSVLSSSFAGPLAEPTVHYQDRQPAVGDQ